MRWKWSSTQPCISGSGRRRLRNCGQVWRRSLLTSDVLVEPKQAGDASTLHSDRMLSRGRVEMGQLRRADSHMGDAGVRLDLAKSTATGQRQDASIHGSTRLRRIEDRAGGPPHALAVRCVLVTYVFQAKSVSLKPSSVAGCPSDLNHEQGPGSRHPDFWRTGIRMRDD